MNVVKVALALLLAGGVVYAYFNFPNPMEQQVQALAAEKPKPAEMAGTAGTAGAAGAAEETPAPPSESR